MVGVGGGGPACGRGIPALVGSGPVLVWVLVSLVGLRLVGGPGEWVGVWGRYVWSAPVEDGPLLMVGGGWRPVWVLFP